MTKLVVANIGKTFCCFWVTQFTVALQWQILLLLFSDKTFCCFSKTKLLLAYWPNLFIAFEWQNLMLLSSDKSFCSLLATICVAFDWQILLSFIGNNLCCFWVTKLVVAFEWQFLLLLSVTKLAVAFQWQNLLSLIGKSCCCFWMTKSYFRFWGTIWRQGGGGVWTGAGSSDFKKNGFCRWMSLESNLKHSQLRNITCGKS